MTGADIGIDVAADNDVVLKAVCYRLCGAFWPGLGATVQIGVLGAAQFVVRGRVEQAVLAGDRELVRAEMRSLLDVVTTLEPTDSEIALAADMEVAAAEALIDGLDGGETQLLAMVALRLIPWLETGDKRAIKGAERLLAHVPHLAALAGRVRCLEQIVVRTLMEDRPTTNVVAAICAEPAVDKSLSYSCGCFSKTPAPKESVLEGLASYIRDLRENAPSILAT